MKTKRRSSIWVKLVVLILITYSVVTLIQLRSKIEAAEADLATKQRQVDKLTAENESLQHEINTSNDPETIERIARDKLGLVKPGERIYYDISN